MTQSIESRSSSSSSNAADQLLVVYWAAETNEQRGPMRWLGSWLVGSDGVEGPWFYSGFGNEASRHEIPAGATGVRIRKWVSEGLDPEYVDVPFDGTLLVKTDGLDFDTPQPHRIFVPAAI